MRVARQRGEARADRVGHDGQLLCNCRQHPKGVGASEAHAVSQQQGSVVLQREKRPMHEPHRLLACLGGKGVHEVGS
jgi:hypothetical protein